MSRDRKLTAAQRDEIVVRLAAFETPCEIRDSLKREHGITISHHFICSLEPTRTPARPPTMRTR